MIYAFVYIISINRYDYLGEDGEILGEDAEDMHALAVSESVRETYHLDELSDSMWEDIYEVRY